MIRSSQLNIVTPQKDVEANRTAFEQEPDDVFSKSELIGAITCVHEYLEHGHIELVDLRKFNLSVHDADMISQAFQRKFDNPSSVTKLEERAINEGYFTSFLSEYIKEEFCCTSSDNSFTIIVVIHCIFGNSLCVDTVLSGLLHPLYSQMRCHKCVSGKSLEEKHHAAFVHNNAVYNAGSSCESEEFCDERGLDDNPGMYALEEVFGSAASSSKNVEASWNPFDSSDDDEINVMSRCSAPFNSTISYNPFDEELSSPKKPKGLASKMVSCEHCKYECSNRNNLKQHLIRDLSQLIN